MDELDKAFRQWSNGNGEGYMGCYSFERGVLYQHGIPIALRRRYPSGLIIGIREGCLTGKLETRLRPEKHFRGKRVVGINNVDFEKLSSAFSQIDKFHRTSKAGWRMLLVGDFTLCGELLKVSQDILRQQVSDIAQVIDMTHAGFAYLLRGHAQAVCYSPTKWTKGKYKGHQFDWLNANRQRCPSQWMSFKSMDDAVHAKLSHPPGFKLLEIPSRS